MDAQARVAPVRTPLLSPLVSRLCGVRVVAHSGGDLRAEQEPAPRVEALRTPAHRHAHADGGRRAARALPRVARDAGADARLAAVESKLPDVEHDVLRALLAREVELLRRELELALHFEESAH